MQLSRHVEQLQQLATHDEDASPTVLAVVQVLGELAAAVDGHDRQGTARLREHLAGGGHGHHRHRLDDH